MYDEKKIRVLEGLEATTHWASLDVLEEFGATPVGRRVVEQGKVVTAAGVSSGIDMALTLAARIAGDDVAQAIQLGIDDWVGSIEVGKDADLVIWENNSLSAYAKTLTTIVDGRIVFDVERDAERQEMIAGEKEALESVVSGR